MMEHNDTSPELNAPIPLVFDDEDEFEDDPMVSPFLFQGDILLNEIQMDNFLGQLQSEIKNKSNTETICTRTKRAIQSPMDYMLCVSQID
uniref:DDE_Tnp_1_7 domain-containing protein n=1 Tax=Rhabditophanes sp. KR3021 TaxID=114890 RepID=A0AC35TPM5_9BILA